jgi:hypothetical protein
MTRAVVVSYPTVIDATDISCGAMSIPREKNPGDMHSSSVLWRILDNTLHSAFLVLTVEHSVSRSVENEPTPATQQDTAVEHQQPFQ